MINVTSAMRKRKQSNEDQDYLGYGQGLANLSRVVKISLVNKVTLEQSLDGGEGVTCAGTWGKSVPRRGTIQCKRPNVACSRNSREVSVDRTE